VAKPRAYHELAAALRAGNRHLVAGWRGEYGLRRMIHDTWWSPKFLLRIVSYFSHNEKVLLGRCF
jgi:hypothetical protein